MTRPLASQAEIRAVENVYQVYAQSAIYRATFANHWEETAQIIMPDAINTFYRENYNFPGIKKTERQIDVTGMMHLEKFSAICDSMITPFSSKWHGLESTNPYLMKQRGVRLWFEQGTKALFKVRYTPAGNFRQQNTHIFKQVGAFGNGPMFIDQLYDMFNRPARGIRYKSLPLGEVYIRVNHQGQVDAFVRCFRMTARQMVQKFGDEMLPDELRSAFEKQSETLYDLFHCVYPNLDYDPGHPIGVGSKMYRSHYVSCSGRRLMNDMAAGYNSFPLAFARYTQDPNEIYARGPAMRVLPSLKTLNAEKTTFLTAGHRGANPVFITGDDGITDFSWRPGALNKGGVNSDGKPLVHVLPAGDIQISEEMMQDERNIIGEAFLTTIFQTLVENPQMTATQVIEVINQKGIFLAPTVGGMGTGYLDPLIERELDLAMSMGLLPPMPPVMREARGEYNVVYTSPLFKAARAGEASGFLRTVESATQIAGQTGDPSILDRFEFDVALPEIANIQDVPESWMASDESVRAKRQRRAKQVADQQAIQALPAQAAMVKAQATVRKQGGGLPNNGPIQNQ